MESTLDLVKHMTMEQLRDLRDIRREELAKATQERHNLVGQILFYENAIKERKQNDK